jgi:hypothetical protein
MLTDELYYIVTVWAASFPAIAALRVLPRKTAVISLADFPHGHVTKRPNASKTERVLARRSINAICSAAVATTIATVIRPLSFLSFVRQGQGHNLSTTAAIVACETLMADLTNMIDPRQFDYVSRPVSSSSVRCSFLCNLHLEKPTINSNDN